MSLPLAQIVLYRVTHWASVMPRISPGLVASEPGFRIPRLPGWPFQTLTHVPHTPLDDHRGHEPAWAPRRACWGVASPLASAGPESTPARPSGRTLLRTRRHPRWPSAPPTRSTPRSPSAGSSTSRGRTADDALRPDRRPRRRAHRRVRALAAVRLPPDPLMPNSDECSTCGQPHVTSHGKTSCLGHVTHDRASYVKGQDRKKLPHPIPCKQSPMIGLAVCAAHGGKAAHAKAAGERKAAEGKIAAAARKLIPDADDLTPISNPLERLLELASEADAFRESLRLLANNIQGEIRYRGVGAGAEQLRAEVAMYRTAIKDVTDLLVAIARLDIEATLARITVRQAEQSMAAMRAGMDEAQLDEDQKRKVMAGVGRHLRAVAG